MPLQLIIIASSKLSKINILMSFKSGEKLGDGYWIRGEQIQTHLNELDQNWENPMKRKKAS